MQLELVYYKLHFRDTQVPVLTKVPVPMNIEQTLSPYLPFITCSTLYTRVLPWVLIQTYKSNIEGEERNDQSQKLSQLRGIHGQVSYPKLTLYQSTTRYTVNVLYPEQRTKGVPKGWFGGFSECTLLFQDFVPSHHHKRLFSINP